MISAKTSRHVRRVISGSPTDHGAFLRGSLNALESVQPPRTEFDLKDGCLYSVRCSGVVMKHLDSMLLTSIDYACIPDTQILPLLWLGRVVRGPCRYVHGHQYRQQRA